ncbi:MAG: hypothetical protein V1831_00435 [Candidatus Woesearchaeota archaeon]
MRKFLLISILALFLYIVSVSAAIDIINTSVTLNGIVGQTSYSSFLVSNTGTGAVNINFTIPQLSYGTNKLTLNSFKNITNLAGNSTYIANFSVTIPSIPSQKRAGLYTGTLNATSNLFDSDTITINVNVAPTYSVSTNPASEMNLGLASLNSTHTGTFTITNTGNANIPGVSFGFSDSDFNLRANNTNFVLAFNTTETIKFNITIPADYSTGNVTLGSVNLVSTELNEALFNVKAEVGGGLIIEDLDVFLNTRKSKSGSDLDVYDGKKLNFDNEDAGPGSELRFNFNIENTFSDKEDIDINDITVKITIEEIDDGGDLEEESKEFDMDPDSNEDLDVVINLPLSVDIGVYDIIIEVLGEDDNGNEHTAQMSLKLDIDKEPRDVIISNAYLFPEKIKCSGSSTLTATIKNLGKTIEENAMLEIISKDLNIDSKESSIKLEEDPFDTDNEFTKKLIINIDKSMAAKTYPITLKAYLQEQIPWETKTVNLVVEACGDVKETIEEEKIEETTTAAVKETENKTTETEEVPVLKGLTTTEASLTQRPIFWIAVIILNIIVIGGAVFLVTKLIAKK